MNWVKEERQQIEQLYYERRARERKLARYLKTLEGRVESEVQRFQIWLGEIRDRSELGKKFAEYIKSDCGFNDNAQELFVYSQGCNRDEVQKARELLKEKLCALAEKK